MLAAILAWLTVFAVRTVVLFGLLLLLVVLQRLQYNILGLVVSAAIASALDTIPYVGHIIAVPVLYLCISRVTHADVFPDAVFTVAVSYALMFGINLFFLGPWMADLRDKHAEEEPIIAEMEESSPPPVETNPPPVIHTNVFPQSDAARVARQKAALAIVRNFSIKGITRNADRSMVVINSGVKNYDLQIGEAVAMEISNAPSVVVRFEELTDEALTLDINGEPVKVPVR